MTIQNIMIEWKIWKKIKKKIREIFFAQTLCEGVHEQTWQLRLRSLEAIEKQIQGNFQKELVSAFAIIILLICFLSRSGIPFLIFALLTAWSILVILGNILPTTIVKNTPICQYNYNHI